MARAALIVLDGWGLADPGPGNAVELADTPVFDELWSRFPTTTLTACGKAVGLPEGQMGNSEVGHLNLGAGSVVMQDLTRIDAAAEGGELAGNEVLRAAFADAPRVHIIGLVSEGGVHSSMDHLRALIELGAALDVPDLVVHAFTDGRDTTPKSGAGYLEQVTEWMADSGCGRFGSVVGRYYAMDRDKRWDRVKLAYDMLVHGRADASRRHRAPTRRGRPTSATRPTSSSRRRWWARRRGSVRRTRCWASTSAPTACARSPAPWPSPALTSSTATAASRWSATRR